jgi:F-type H+-transporting ATPase subunit epsilon
MNQFEAILRDQYQEVRLPQVCAWHGRDASGSFTLLARHAPFMTLTEPGLSRLRVLQEAQERTWFLGCTQALVEFEHNRLFISARRFFLNPDQHQIAADLTAWLEAKGERRAQFHQHWHSLENDFLRKLNQATAT